MLFPKSLVIVPTYNEKENILLMLEAILSQHECLEVLVVDDGSPDVLATWSLPKRKRIPTFT